MNRRNAAIRTGDTLLLGRSTVPSREAEKPRPPEDDDVESYQKMLVTRYVLPIMAGMSALFYAAYVSLEPRKLIIFGLGLIVTSTNIFLTSRNRRLRIGPWEMMSRSDPVDAARWMFNLLIGDVMLFVGFRPSPAACVAVWLVLIVSAQTDTFRRRHRFAVVGVGLVTGAAVLTYLYPGMRLMEYLLVVFSMTGIVAMFGIMESYWVKEIHARVEARRRETEALYEARLLKQDALIGSHLRTVSHELGNLLSVLDMATSMEAGTIQGTELDITRRAVDYAKKINTLLLSDTRAADTVRTLSVRALLEDLELLLSKDVRRRQLKWQVTVEAEAQDATFKERAGSTYFIIHNFVKNAWEAFERNAERQPIEQGHVHLSAERRCGSIILSVVDNGTGMPPERCEAILRGRADSTKPEGHGLGLRFALEECRRNNFDLRVESKPGEGTRFQLIIPAED